MGVYDTVIFRCLECGKDIEKQSKAGDCNLMDYDQNRVPMEIAATMQHDLVTCRSCETTFSVEMDAPTTVPLYLKPREDES